ncbi:MAG: fatty acyl-AMP ligase [Chloroflexi bacterium]|nr:fatty acyl-AMP ligase [Chloroflexota bacterium]
MTTFASRLHSHLSRTPEKIALTLIQAGRPDRSLRYHELLREAHGYVQVLADRGIQPGEVVVLILQHGEELVASYLGAVILGAVPSIMPFLTEKLSPERYRADLAALVSVTRPAAIVTYDEFEAEVRGTLQVNHSVRTVILTSQVVAAHEQSNSSWEGLKRNPRDVVLLQHSSGTTGLQKGVALSHQAVFNQLSAYSRVLDLKSTDVVVSWLPLYHDMGLIAGFLMPLLEGLHLVLMSPFDWVRAPYRLMQAVSQYKGTLSWLPNFAYNFCSQKIRDHQIQGVDLSSWRAIVNCSEPVRPESHAAFYGRFHRYGLSKNSLHTSYAMAENVFAVTQSDLKGEPLVEEIDREIFLTQRRVESSTGEGKLGMMSSGNPLPNVRIKILDESGVPVPDRTIGEIALLSDCMLRGYYNRPDETKKAFKDKWYLTGDFGYFSGGELFVTGRKKDMIIVGGRNIHPQDLESLTYEVPGVHAGRSVAFGIFNEEQGTEEVVIVTEVEPGEAADRESIAEAIRQHVTKNSAIALRNVKVVESNWIIKTSSGKTARLANKEKYLIEGLQ